MRKDQLREWILEHNCKHDDDDARLYTEEELLPMSKPQLLFITAANKPQKKMLVFDWAKNYNLEHGTDIKINLLPIATPELNPIELIWSNMKKFVADSNHDGKMETIRQLMVQKYNEIDNDPSVWEKACAHADKYAEKYSEYDDIFFELQEGMPEPPPLDDVEVEHQDIEVSENEEEEEPSDDDDDDEQ